MEVRNLEPKAVWNYFEDINAVPRASKKEEQIIAFMQSFGASLNLATIRDAVGNVIIKKPATQGMENRKTIILQSHLDMVHQKNSDTVFDFETQGIQSYIDGDWLRAKGTTLGADNGMGVAAIMALLASSDIPHPALEALFTIDEETGMTGALNLEQGILEGKILLNLDTEDDDEFSIGCAGGIDTNTRLNYEEVAIQGNVAYEINISGLKGGHSGVDIHLDRGNANKIMNRLIFQNTAYEMQIVYMNGGSLRNAIPRESKAIITVNSTAFLHDFENTRMAIISEFEIEEKELKIGIKETVLPTKAMSVALSRKVCLAICACHNGVYRMSKAIDGLVETSSSLARVLIENGKFITQSLQRSSLESGKKDIAQTIAAPFELIACDVENGGAYPGWAPNPQSEILSLMENKYETLFGKKVKVMAIHAGLECGILGNRYPGLDMISFGPTIKGPHSPDERCSISSVQKFWKLLLAVLADSPLK